MRHSYLLLALVLFSLFGCKKDERYLWRDTGSWEIESMQIDYMNASGGIDSTVTSPISGFFMFYNTPTADADPLYMVTHGITVKGIEIHGAHYWRSKHKEIYMEDYNHGVFRIYTVTDKGRNAQSWDYEGKNLCLHTNLDSSALVREHIELKRVQR